MSTALLFEVLERLGKRLGIVGDAIAYSTEINDGNGVIRDYNFLHLLHCAGEVLVVMGILRLGLNGAHGHESKDSYAQR